MTDVFSFLIVVIWALFWLAGILVGAGIAGGIILLILSPLVWAYRKVKV